MWRGAKPRPTSPAPAQTPPPQGPSPRPRPSCEAGNRAALSRRCCRAVRSAAAASRPELGRRGCTRSRDPAARDPSLRRRHPQGAPGRTMVKVTFNSALAQKEAKKDEPKSSEEALIIPPDAVAVDCKVRAGVAGGVLAAGTGARTAHRFPVPWCVCSGRGGVLAVATPLGTVAQVYELQPLCLGLAVRGPAATGTAATEFGTFLPV